MKISVILPAFNAEKTLDRAVQSILNQSFGDFELLIINDGSTDETSALINAYTDPRIKAIHLKQNIGLINVLNKGLEIAQGEYIARMDADDISFPTRFAAQVQFLDSNTDYVACGTSIVNFSDTTESYMRYPQSDEEIRVALCFFERNICHPTVMIRKSALDENKIRYRSDYLYAEDYRLWLELATVGKLHNLSDGLVMYYRHSNQVSSKYYVEQIAISRSILKEALRQVWPVANEKLIDRVIRLCIHQQGIYPEEKFSLKEINKTLKQIIELNDRTKKFDSFYLKRLLYFKKFRCSFYYFYRFNYFTKLICFTQFFLIEPKRAIEDIKMHAKMALVKRFNKW